jgi:hypothetical protein
MKAQLFVEADADAVFDVITDVDRLPEWNDLIEAVVVRPAGMGRGAVWKVRMRAGTVSWVSRSVCLAHYPTARQLRYRSGTDDGNPSYADWAWTVTAAAGGCVVEVAWALHPETFLRRLLGAPVRSRMLRREVPVSLAALARYVTGAARPRRQRAASSG